MIKKVMFNKNKVTIDLGNIDSFKKQLISYYETVLKNINEYCPMYETETISKEEDVLEEKEQLTNQLKKLFSEYNEEYINKLLKGIAVKLNGKFRKNSVNKFLIVKTATAYSDEYEFWNTFFIQLRAVDENTVILEFGKGSFHW